MNLMEHRQILIEQAEKIRMNPDVSNLDAMKRDVDRYLLQTYCMIIQTIINIDSSKSNGTLLG